MIIENFILLPSSWHPPIALIASNLDECIQVMVVHYAAKKNIAQKSISFVNFFWTLEGPNS